jgi:hypothetical protein
LFQTVKLVLVPSISLGDFPLDLPTPTASNCGGYILPSASGTLYAYSPIDLCVAAIEAQRTGKIVTDLSRFHYLNKRMLSIHYVYLGILCDGTLEIHNVSYWQSVNDSGLSAILHKNAPLTFNM